jgi:hypothetical protein
LHPIRKTWADVKVGSYIRAKDGVDWKVTAAKDGFWGLVSRAGESKILPAPKPTAPVDVLYLTPKELETALQETLGAEFTGELADGADIWQCPPWEGRNLTEMKSHLLFFHGISSVSANDPGVSAGMNSKKALTECHEETHRKPGRLHTPHVHTPTKEQW